MKELTLTGGIKIGRALVEAGLYEEALEKFEKLGEIRRRRKGKEEDEEVIYAMFKVAEAKHHLGMVKAALEEFEKIKGKISLERKILNERVG